MCFRDYFEGLMHVWRLNAYYMGMDDVANLVKDSYEDTKKLLFDIGYFIVVPAVLQRNKICVIMGKNVAKALDLDYYVALYMVSEGEFRLLCYQLKINILH